VTLGLWALTGGVDDLLAGGAATSLALSRLSGLVAALAALFGLVLTSRPRWLERAAGLDRLIGWHRITGITAALGMAVHVVSGLIAAAGGSLGGTGRSLVDLVAGTDWFAAALAAALLFVIVSLTSWRRIRRRLHYETWHLVHVVGYVAVALGFPHQLFSGSTFAASAFARWWWVGLYAATTAIILHSRVGGLVASALRPRTTVARVIPEAPGVASLVITGPGVDALGAQPGQFVCLRVLTRQLWWQAHPYSLSAAPQRGALRLTVKALGDGSAQTLALTPGVRVLLEGPYGALSIDRAAGRPVLLIGAGVGVAPIRALLEASQPDQHPVVLARAHSASDVPLAAELDVLARQRDGRVALVTGPRSSFPGGNPFTAEALTTAVPDIADRVAFICGPAALQSRVAGELRRAGVPADRINSERFAW
jgi:predicted ferric reductase